jgi:glycerol uptake facilitator-like aquaporin
VTSSAEFIVGFVLLLAIVLTNKTEKPTKTYQLALIAVGALFCFALT